MERRWPWPGGISSTRFSRAVARKPARQGLATQVCFSEFRSRIGAADGQPGQPKSSLSALVLRELVGHLLARLHRELGLLDLVFDCGELVLTLLSRISFWIAFVCSLRKYSRWVLSICRLTRVRMRF